VETLSVLGAILAAVWVFEVVLYLGLYLTSRVRSGATTQPRS